MELEELLKKEGYFNIIQTKNYGLIGVFRFAFTFGLVVGLDETGYDRRYCYHSLEELNVGFSTLRLQDAMSDNPPEHPVDLLWIKCKGHGIDISNPYKQLKHEH